jgi:hypothetical protein
MLVMMQQRMTVAAVRTFQFEFRVLTFYKRFAFGHFDLN